MTCIFPAHQGGRTVFIRCAGRGCSAAVRRQARHTRPASRREGWQLWSDVRLARNTRSWSLLCLSGGIGLGWFQSCLFTVPFPSLRFMSPNPIANGLAALWRTPSVLSTVTTAKAHSKEREEKKERSHSLRSVPAQDPCLDLFRIRVHQKGEDCFSVCLVRVISVFRYPPALRAGTRPQTPFQPLGS